MKFSLKVFFVLTLVSLFTFLFSLPSLAYTISENLQVQGNLGLQGTKLDLGYTQGTNLGRKIELDFNQGGSKIIDETNLHIETDDNAWLDVPDTLYVQNDMEVGGTLTVPSIAGNLTGNVESLGQSAFSGQVIFNGTLAIKDASLRVANNQFTDRMIQNDITASNYLPLSGGTLLGDLNLGFNVINNINNVRTENLRTTNLTATGTVSLPQNSITDNMIPNTITVSNYLPLAGGTMSGDIALGGNSLTGVATITTTGNATIGGALGVTGATTLSSTLGVTGAATLSSTLAVTGAATFSSTTSLNGVTYTWPSSAGSNGQYLRTDGVDTLSWATVTSLWTDQGSYIYPNNYTTLAVMDTGRVGIGTTAPNNTLQVADLINFDNDYDSTFIGYQAGDTAASGDYNTAVGYQAGDVLDGGDENTFVGYHAGKSNDDGYYNVFMGNEAGYSSETSGYNVAIGHSAFYTDTYSEYNVAIGYQALYSSDGDGNNTAVGAGALTWGSAGRYNVAVGYNALTNNEGSNNIAIGTNAGGGGYTSGFANNVVVGYIAMSRNGTGSKNVVLGSEAGLGSYGQSYSNEVFIGYKAGYAITSGSNNILLGYQAGDNLTTGANNIIIGYDLNAPSATESNQMYLGGVIYANTSTGLVGIGTTGPASKLDVDGGIRPDQVTSDPCGSGYPEGTLFYNTTGNYFCYCDGTNDVKMHDPTADCF